jgi:hypothetical protein
LLKTGQWFSPGTLVFLINKTDIHYIAEILLKVALNTIKQLYDHDAADVTYTFKVAYCRKQGVMTDTLFVI